MCANGSNDIEVVGYCVAKGVKSLHENYVKKTGDANRPNTKKDVQFIGLTSYHREFIPNYANVTGLVRATRKNLTLLQRST